MEEQWLTSTISSASIPSRSSGTITNLSAHTTELRVLDFLMDNESFDYSKTDIAEGTELSRATLFKVWPKQEALGLITATRTVGKAKMYRLNKKNPIVQKLMELDDAISEYFALKHCDPEAVSTNDIAEIVAPGQDLIKAITEYESEPPSDGRLRPKELLSA